jgi:hypothetical protein
LTCRIALQVQQLGAALAEFERLSHAHSRQGSALLTRANRPGWLFAEAAEQAGKALQEEAASVAEHLSPAAPSPSSAAAAGAAAAAAAMSSNSSSNAGVGSLQQQLGRHVNARHLHMVSLHMANTLSRLQIAKLLVRRDATCRLQVTILQMSQQPNCIYLQLLLRKRVYMCVHFASCRLHSAGQRVCIIQYL